MKDGKRRILRVEWKLYDKDGNFVQEVNCQYDGIDLAVMLCAAVRIEIDMTNKTARVVE